MELSQLDPDRDYSEVDTASYYHGINAYQIEGILDGGTEISKNRRESTDYELMVAHLHEDLIRHLGSDVTDTKLRDGEEVREYIDEHRQELLSEGSEHTQWLIEESDAPLEEGLYVVDNLVWVSRDEHEARNYSASSDLAGCEKRSGGYFEFTLPEDSVLQMGLNGGVPGEIPLEFADNLYLEMDQNEREQVWLDFVSSEYDVNIRSI